MRFIPKQFFFSALFLFLCLITYQCTTIAHTSNHYVDKNANGGNNGTSWADAWQSFSAIDWDLISPGDVIYISGGTDSTIYNETLFPKTKGTATNRITIIAGKYAPDNAGHSGRAILDGNNGALGRNIYIEDYAGGAASYVTIKGLECRRAVAGVEMNADGAGKGMVFDSLVVYDFYDQAGFTIKGGDSTTIRYCSITTPLLVAGQTDCIYADQTSRMFVHDNFIRNLNQDPYAHNDAIQGQNADGWVIYNNIIINDSVYSPEGGGMPLILGSTDYGNNNPVIIYNNFIYMGGAWWCHANMGYGLNTRFYAGQSQQSDTWIIHNTIVINGPRISGVGYEYNVTASVNNIIAMYCLLDGVLGQNWVSDSYCHGWQIPYNVSGQNIWSNPSVDSIRNNLYWKERNTDFNFGGTYTNRSGNPAQFGSWASWVAGGGTGLRADPLFFKKFGHEPDQGALNGELQFNSAAKNKGENAKWYIDYFNKTYNLNLPWADIDGNPRDNTPTIGAYE